MTKKRKAEEREIKRACLQSGYVLTTIQPAGISHSFHEDLESLLDEIAQIRDVFVCVCVASVRQKGRKLSSAALDEVMKLAADR